MSRSFHLSPVHHGGAIVSIVEVIQFLVSISRTRGSFGFQGFCLLRLATRRHINMPYFRIAVERLPSFETSRAAATVDAPGHYQSQTLPLMFRPGLENFVNFIKFRCPLKNEPQIIACSKLEAFSIQKLYTCGVAHPQRTGKQESSVVLIRCAEGR